MLLIMIYAKAFAFLRLAANFALNIKWERAAPASCRPTPSPIFVNHFATTNTWSCNVLHALSAVVHYAKTLSAMRSIAQLTLASRKVNSGVLRSSADLKIFNRIIAPVSVFVMTYFRGKQWPFKKFAHYKSMLWNPAVAVSVWMIWLKKHNVTNGAYFPELLPDGRHWSIVT